MKYLRSMEEILISAGRVSGKHNVRERSKRIINGLRKNLSYATAKIQQGEREVLIKTDPKQQTLDFDIDVRFDNDDDCPF